MIVIAIWLAHFGKSSSSPSSSVGDLKKGEENFGTKMVLRKKFLDVI